MAGDPHPLLLYDGHCALCNAWVRILLSLDRRDELRYAALQSDLARDTLRGFGVDAASTESLVLVEGAMSPAASHGPGEEQARILFKSDAVYGAIARIGFPLKYLAYGRYLPRFLRDRVYDFIAANRYVWFSRYESCPAPPPEHRHRFLDLG